MQLALGHYLTFRHEGIELHRFQNFWIGQNVGGHSFLPFGFGGITVARSGDNVDSNLTFPNNGIARGWADEAIKKGWIAVVSLRILNDPTDPGAGDTQLNQYTGQVSAGGWDETTVSLRLNSVLDAVNGDVPNRTLHQRLVGALPFSGSLLF